MPDAVTRPSQRERRDTTRTRLLEAAIRLFGEHGYHRTQVLDIVTQARVSAGTFYRYFDDKRGIFAAIADQLSLHEVDEARKARDMIFEAPDFASAVRNMVSFLERHFERVTQHAALYSALQNSGVIDRGKDHAGAMRELVIQVMTEQLRRSGRKDTDDLESLARMVVGVMSGLRHGMIQTGKPSPARAARLVTRFLQGAMAAYTTCDPKYRGLFADEWRRALNEEAPV